MGTQGNRNLIPSIDHFLEMELLTTFPGTKITPMECSSELEVLGGRGGERDRHGILK